MKTELNEHIQGLIEEYIEAKNHGSPRLEFSLLSAIERTTILENLDYKTVWDTIHKQDGIAINNCSVNAQGSVVRSALVNFDPIYPN